jgi:3-methyladenine DNA glycosylase AlkD
MIFEKCVRELNKLKNPAKAKILAGFFKTGKGEYGEGDVFLGITVPLQRTVAKKFIGLDFLEIQKLLNSKIHEHRLVALLILVEKYRKGEEKEKGKVVKMYLKNTKKINNWDLVDLSAHYILGDYLLTRNRKILYKLACSKNLWEKRIAIISTFALIRAGEFEDTLKISKILLKDNHDLIHKAVGWMLREVGKRDQKVEEKFLLRYYSDMSRTTLRYAIERFPKEKRQSYLNK